VLQLKEFDLVITTTDEFSHVRHPMEARGPDQPGRLPGLGEGVRRSGIGGTVVELQADML